jgi:hypothetical protein
LIYNYEIEQKLVADVDGFEVWIGMQSVNTSQGLRVYQLRWDDNTCVSYTNWTPLYDAATQMANTESNECATYSNFDSAWFEWGSELCSTIKHDYVC